MKKNFILFLSAMLMVSAFQVQGQGGTVYPGVTDTSRVYQAPKATTPPVIDGNPTDAAWALAPWQQAFAVQPLSTDWPVGTTPAGKEGAFSGAEDLSFKYKFIWDDNHIYWLLRWTDDEVVYSDNHNGYRVGSVPTYATATGSVPAAGTGDGSAFQAFRMDHIALYFTAHTDALAAGATYSRANNGLKQDFYPGKITKAVQAEAVLWAPKHNPVSTTSGAPQTHQATVAGSFNAGENVYYIEFRDTTWTALFSTVRTKLTGQKDYATNPPAIGDKFLFTGEINDADGLTNRRDYPLFISALRTNPASNLKEAIVITLVNTVTTGVKTASAKRNLEFYPNPNSTGTLSLNRIANVEIFNMTGQRILQSVNTSEVNISKLQPGVYILKDTEGNVGKLVRK